MRAAPPQTAGRQPPRLAQRGLAPRPGPAVLGPPLPASPEATTPPPYETPGLAAATAASGPGRGAAAATARIAAEARSGPAGSTRSRSARRSPPTARRSVARLGPGGVVLPGHPARSPRWSRAGAPRRPSPAPSPAGEAWRAPARGRPGRRRRRAGGHGGLMSAARPSVRSPSASDRRRAPWPRPRRRPRNFRRTSLPPPQGEGGPRMRWRGSWGPGFDPRTRPEPVLGPTCGRTRGRYSP